MSRVPFGKAEKELIQAVVYEINNNRRHTSNLKGVKQKTTIYEYVLMLFLEKGSKGVKLPRLRKEVSKHSSAADLDLATSKLMGGLRRKVKAKGGKILSGRTPGGVLKYWITKDG